jgi:uncharacterized protein (DUF983 family)
MWDYATTESGDAMTWTTNIQWHGTDICMDLICPECGEHSHFDGYFAFVIQCPHCTARFKMPTEIPLVPFIGDPEEAQIMVGRP